MLLWLLLFVTLCAAVALYQTRITHSARAERDSVRGSRTGATAEIEDRPDGFGHAIVGQASGAPLVEPEPRRVPADPPRAAPPRTDDAAAHGDQHVVKRGESLSTICQLHYGTGRAEVVAALARVNKLKSIDAIREGQTLAIPPLGDLHVAPK